MRTILYHHIVETMPVGPGDTVLGLPVEKRVMHSIVTASRETGRHPKRLRKVLGAAGLIPPNHETLSDQYVKFDASTASDTLEANTTSLLLTDAAAYLHTSEQQMRMLTRKGFIRTYVERRRGDRARLLTYAIKDLDAFMARLTMHAEPIDHPSKMMVSIPVAARRAKCEATTIIRWVLNKRVTRVGRHTGSEQYASILVDIREIVRQTNVSVEGYVSIREAAGLLRRHRIVIDRLIADGHLSFVDGKLPSNNVSAKLIAKSEIQAFREKYISIQEIARTLDIPKGWVAYRMGSIKPVIEQSRVGATYYRRDSVPHV